MIVIELINRYKRTRKTASASLCCFIVANIYICHHVYTKTAMLTNGQCNLSCSTNSSHKYAATLCLAWLKVFATCDVCELPYNIDKRACHYVNDNVKVKVFCLRYTFLCIVSCACI